MAVCCVLGATAAPGVTEALGATGGETEKPLDWEYAEGTVTRHAILKSRTGDGLLSVSCLSFKSGKQKILRVILRYSGLEKAKGAPGTQMRVAKFETRAWNAAGPGRPVLVALESYSAKDRLWFVQAPRAQDLTPGLLEAGDVRIGPAEKGETWTALRFGPVGRRGALRKLIDGCR